jgi:hypothetical protein
VIAVTAIIIEPSKSDRQALSETSMRFLLQGPPTCLYCRAMIGMAAGTPASFSMVQMSRQALSDPSLFRRGERHLSPKSSAVMVKERAASGISSDWKVGYCQSTVGRRQLSSQIRASRSVVYSRQNTNDCYSPRPIGIFR